MQVLLGAVHLVSGPGTTITLRRGQDALWPGRGTQRTLLLTSCSVAIPAGSEAFHQATCWGARAGICSSKHRSSARVAIMDRGAPISDGLCGG
mmetsp:Transcript_131281/g.318907  ORF Transcript_131281/g.318907 Transcript_131281/m.318907 type:complete len:93 (-) Transcript_131281:437-715(-)